MPEIPTQQFNFSKPTSLLLLLSFYSIFSQNNPDHFITINKNWFIVSPVIGQSVFIYEQKNDYIEFLQSIGEQADELWTCTKDKSALAGYFHELFKSVDRTFLSNVIDQILQNEQLLISITEKSYRNVTGFVKIVLADGGKNSWKIRLHVWQEQEAKEFPHNHKWDFYSKIISGYLSQEIYEKIDGCALENSLSQRYSVREPVSLMPILENGEAPCPCRDDYVLTAKNTICNVALGLESRDIIALGESYLMPFQAIHAINPGRNAISLVFTSRNVVDNSEVFVPIDMIDTDLRRHAPSLTTDILKEELFKTKHLLSQLQVHENYLPEVIDYHHHYKKSIPNDLNWRRGIIENPSHQIVIQLSKQAMKKFVVSAEHDGTLLVGANRIDYTCDYLFVLFEGNMYACPKDFSQQSQKLICHSSFTDYGSVESAGVLCFNDAGNLIRIEAYSGHYTPPLANMEIAKKHLDTIGVNTQIAVLSSYQDRL